MDALTDAFATDGHDAAILRSAQCSATAPDALERLARGLGEGPFALVVLFASPEANPITLPGRAAAAFPGTPIIGCTTAGEISANGYTEGEIVALGLPARHFAAQTLLVPDLRVPGGEQLIGDMVRGELEDIIGWASTWR